MLPESYPKNVVPYPKAVQRSTQYRQGSHKSASFSDQFLRGLKPSSKGRYEVFDAGTKHQKYPGFGCRVSPKGKKTFFCLYRAGGKLKRWTIGTFPEVTLKDAREAVLKIRTNRQDPALEKAQVRKAGSFTELVQKFRQEYVDSDNIRRPLRPRTRYEYGRLLDNVLIPYFESYKAGELTYENVEKFLEDKKETRFEGNRAYQVLSRMYSWARKKRILQNDPCSGVEQYEEVPRQRWLRESELKRILKAADKEEPLYREAVWWLLLHGSRPSEVYDRLQKKGIRWENIDADAQEWYKPQTKTTSHLVPLTQAAMDVLERVKKLQRNGSDFVFPRMRWDGLTKRLRARSKVKDFRLYDFRASSATWMQRLEIDPDIIDRVQGRDPGGPKVRRAYQQHAYLKEKRQALERWHKEVIRIYHG